MDERQQAGDGRDHGAAVAVALADDGATGGPPLLRASGRGKVAQQILELAFAHDVPVREDADLAEVLAAVDVDSPIPLAALGAVAEILAYVYRANGGTEAHVEEQTGA